MLERLPIFNCFSCFFPSPSFPLSTWNTFQLIRYNVVLHTANALAHFLIENTIFAFVTVYHENVMKLYRAAIIITRIVKHTGKNNQYCIRSAVGRDWIVQ